MPRCALVSNTRAVLYAGCVYIARGKQVWPQSSLHPSESSRELLISVGVCDAPTYSDRFEWAWAEGLLLPETVSWWVSCWCGWEIWEIYRTRNGCMNFACAPTLTLLKHNWAKINKAMQPLEFVQRNLLWRMLFFFVSFYFWSKRMLVQRPFRLKWQTTAAQINSERHRISMTLSKWSPKAPRSAHTVYLFDQRRQFGSSTDTAAN